MFWKLKEDPNWRPYCLVCSTMNRMDKRIYGFQCMNCYNKIDNDMNHYEENK